MSFGVGAWQSAKKVLSANFIPQQFGIVYFINVAARCPHMGSV